ncbi:hypothetical protein [Chromobacterium paludis]|uniref:Receptor-recognising protein Gp38 domain-containing protein n=1 Tax=Chromobacterium paludis TaxID=2605945 RepID=A0A5C1DK66_9NEIS|nr:hypothetical protein [Chromobacterium paludis]QEL57042.1 hypothetical protein FYK34_16480 [Chromobacterium paludis]
MPKTYVDQKQVKHWYVDGRKVQKAYQGGRLVFQDELVVVLAASNYNFDTGSLHQQMVTAAGGSWPQGATFRVIVQPGVQLVSKDTSNACFWFGGAIVGNTVIVENYGQILGRGGKGGDCGNRPMPGENGSAAIWVDGGIKLFVSNQGLIAGGGGGGAGGLSIRNVGTRRYRCSGGGGAPFGPAGACDDASGGSANYEQAGNTHTSWVASGSGGAWGQSGSGGIYSTYNGRPGGKPQEEPEDPYQDESIPGGTAGPAIGLINGATCSYLNRGDLRGNAP